jgi:2-polyprenyl-3-methyl-5-hydroxy-6-metoxy-1,4-benzoquinol methylase
MKTFSTKPSSDETLNAIPCPICSSNDFSPYWDCDGFSFVECLKCHLLMQNPQPAFEALDNRYDEEYFQYEQNNDEQFFDLMLKGLKDIGFDPLSLKDRQNRTFLDIGCATGLLVDYMQKCSWNARGVELCAPAAEYGSKTRGIEIFSGTVEQAAYGDGTFDVVHCSHLIEHLNSPDLFLEEVYRILKPGGLFLCTTPNADGFQARMFASRWRSAIADHTFLFSRRTLRRLLIKKRFSVLKVKTWGGMGVGYAPKPVKKIMDSAAKKFSFGDVMIFSAVKSN